MYIHLHSSVNPLHSQPSLSTLTLCHCTVDIILCFPNLSNIDFDNISCCIRRRYQFFLSLPKLEYVVLVKSTVLNDNPLGVHNQADLSLLCYLKIHNKKQSDIKLIQIFPPPSTVLNMSLDKEMGFVERWVSLQEPYLTIIS